MATATDVAQRIQRHLRDLRGPDSLRIACRLFSDLNYDASEMVPLSRRDWPTAAREALAEDPRVIARHGDFQVIYSRLGSQRLDRTKERAVIDRLTRQHPFALYLFSDADASDWHFVNVKYDDDETRRRVLRRFAVGPDERFGDRLRTVSQQLTAVALDDDELDRLEREPLALQQRYDRAFDVESVTREFYREYRRVFEQAEASVRGIEGDERRLFTQRLFNRLMFVAFIQKKGWLRLPGQHGTDYLSALWVAYQKARERGEAGNFYEDRLKLLFFSGLNTAHGNGITTIRSDGFLQQIIGDVPYLNGGLFEPDAIDERSDIVVPDDAVHPILESLFDRFNFTISESTPLDVEVAVDPEMLGKVFEELVTGRHETGSYYTPKPIVSFMCREALKGYLGSALPGESADALAPFVDAHDPAGLRDFEAVLSALRNVRACDPACGSGAYLLGMLHELLALRDALFAKHRLDHPSNYLRKLEIIERSLYGVDIDPFAVNIARLRLWLSLAVDFVGDKPEPLPNLDFKIEQGDSVLGPSPVSGMQDSARNQLIQQYVRLKDDYLTAHSGTKRQLRREIEETRRQIALWARGGGAVEGFDWGLEFAEVFAAGGFDVVLANPPYVRHELITEHKPSLKRVYGDLYSGIADLYVFFYYRALQLLKSGGMLVFISSNKWFRANYGKKLRAHIAATTAVRSITDFGDQPVFESATAYPMIFVSQKCGKLGPTRYTEVASLASPYPDVRALIEAAGQELPPEALCGENWTLASAETAARLQTMSRGATTLDEYVKGQIYYGIKTGLNEAFVIDGQTREALIAADLRSAEIIKPLVVGKDIRKWCVDYKDRWLIVTAIGVPIQRYPAVFAHLSQWKEKLEKRSDQGKHWWELRACDYYEEFDKPKIVYPDIAKNPRFAYSPQGLFSNDTTFFMPTDDLFLLALLNSSAVAEWFHEAGAEIRGGYLRFKQQYIVNIPIPRATASEREVVSQFVGRCIELRGLGPDAECIQVELDARVARLYGLKR